MKFKEWLFRQEYNMSEGATRTAGKSIHYPLGYGGLGLYPPSWYIPYSADSILYLSIDERLYSNGDGPPFDIRHLPGHKKYKNPNNHDKAPFDISKLPGDNGWKKYDKAGDKCPFDISKLPGSKDCKKYDKAMDGPPFSIKHLPAPTDWKIYAKAKDGPPFSIKNLPK